MGLNQTTGAGLGGQLGITNMRSTTQRPQIVHLRSYLLRWRWESAAAESKPFWVRPRRTPQMFASRHTQSHQPKSEISPGPSVSIFDSATQGPHSLLSTLSCDSLQWLSRINRIKGAQCGCSAIDWMISSKVPQVPLTWSLKVGSEWSTSACIAEF